MKLVNQGNFIVALLVFVCAVAAPAAETWQTAMAQMPLGTNIAELNKTNFANTVLNAFRENSSVKALVLMPGCTDEFYFFNRGLVRLTNAAPTLLDAITALTNQTLVRATFYPPYLLLHTHEDPVEPLIRIEDNEVAERLKKKPFAPHFLYLDRDWDYVQPILNRTFSSRLTGYPEFLPRAKTSASWHFFRHSLAAWNLNGWEALEALSLAGKTVITIQKRRVLFEGDLRVGHQQGHSR
jgi:hypothetical protein